MGVKCSTTSKKQQQNQAANTNTIPITSFLEGSSSIKSTEKPKTDTIDPSSSLKRSVRKSVGSFEKISADPFAKLEAGKEMEVALDNSADYLDVVFCIDTTASMSSYITRSKKVICNMINLFSQNEEKPLFGIVAYRDHPPEESSYVTKIHNLSSAAEALSFLEGLEADGGGDIPEAVLQGLSDSVLKISWRNLQIPQKTYNKLLIHVGDAPPHGNDFHDSSMNDYWPDKCPSGISLDQLAEIINSNYIFYHFCRLKHNTDKMAMKFKAAFERFELIDLIVNKANLMIQRQEFEHFKEEFHDEEYINRSFRKMSGREQSDVIYEAKVSRSLAKKMTRKNFTKN